MPVMRITTFLEDEKDGLGLEPQRSNGRVSWYLCPFHSENSASFKVEEHADGTEWAHCFGGCAEGENHFLDVVGILRWLPAHQGGFRHIIDNREAFRLAHRAAEERGLAEPSVPGAPHQASQRPKMQGYPPATPEQIEAMTIAFEYWHVALMTPVGDAAREWLLQTKGLTGPYLDLVLKSVGYMPGEAHIHQAIMEKLRYKFGREAVPLAESVGLLTKEHHTQRLMRRLIFACRAPDGRVHYYQARSLGDNTPKAFKFLNPPGIAKYPYIPLPAMAARFPGTWFVEGGRDADAYAAQGFFALAALHWDVGTVLTREELLALPRPWALSQDDEPGKAGGNARAQQQQLAERLGIPHFVVPLCAKDPALELEQLGALEFTQRKIVLCQSHQRSQQQLLLQSAAPSVLSSPLVTPVATPTVPMPSIATPRKTTTA